MTTQTLTLSAFLLARIEEDEAVASRSGKTWNTLLSRTPKGSANHVSRWDPFAVRLECEPKRAVVERASLLAAHDDMGSSTAEDGIFILEALAHTYAGHPDYDPRWS